jgi:hypothetical protein
MRGKVIGATVLAAWLALCAPARAGLYNTHPGANPPPGGLAFEQLTLWLRELREVPLPKLPGANRPMRDFYVAQEASLREVERRRELTQEERADLGACYLRLGKVAEARRALRKGSPNHFLIQANLAAAYFAEKKEVKVDLKGELARRKAGGHAADPSPPVKQNLTLAILWQKKLLDNWPKACPGWDQTYLDRQRRAELLFLRLLELRKKEGKPPDSNVPLDDLFPGVKFGASPANYPGQMGWGARDHPPLDATDLVFELVHSAPWDDRLVWQLAELFNAYGRIEAAYSLMVMVAPRPVDDKKGALGFNRLTPYWGLEIHRDILYRLVTPPKADQKSPLQTWRELKVIEPGRADRAFNPVHARVSLALVPTASSAALVYYVEHPPLAPPDEQPQQQQKQPEPATPATFTWRHLTIAFVAGFLIAMLLILQLQELRRRRQAAAAAAPPEPEPGPPDEALAPQEGIQAARPEGVRPASG